MKNSLKSWAQRPLPVWFRTEVSRTVACVPDATMVHRAIIISGSRQSFSAAGRFTPAADSLDRLLPLLFGWPKRRRRSATNVNPAKHQTIGEFYENAIEARASPVPTEDTLIR